MSSAKTRAVSEINLEEFERRLRAAGAPQAGVEDPLSELRRLVNTIAAERPRNEKGVDIASVRRDTQAPSRSEGAHPSSPPVAPPAPAPAAWTARVAPPAPGPVAPAA